MSVRQELEAIQARNPDGLLVVEEAHEWARTHPKSELHGRIEWDTSKAAFQYQLDQIRRIIAIEMVTVEHKRTHLSLSIDRTKPKGGYRSVDDIMSSAEMRAVALQDALNELDRVRAKYEWLEELTGIWAAKDRVSKRKSKGRHHGDDDRVLA